ncbi:hypothetical protein [Thalassomonas actiniarum]|uniref:Uncharacterized protein n=1 Tax=Thalassomonas actiniarum TaxID=485447 RepID=A0AAF0C2W7_9GAMM|nr:hypothetical protein [Thalassomonas actiniarum]WDD98275.1 hypothetical protein SG35_023850 [Thalassomonas actiniarum]
MKDINTDLNDKIASTLLVLEEGSDIVITTANMQEIVTKITNAIKEVYAGEVFTPNELFVLSLLAHEASKNESMFQGELQAITGFDRVEMAVFSKKIRALTGM